MAIKILIVFAVLLSALAFYAFVIEPRRLIEKHFLIRKDKSRVLDISEAYDMFQQESDVVIAHLSDLHFSRWFKPRRINKLIRSIMADQPDLIIFTGDLLDDYKKWPVKQTPALIAKLKKLHAPMGKLAVLGNHDYKSDGGYFVKDILESAGFTVLINEDVFGSDERLSLNIAGIADPTTEKSQFYFEDTLAEWQILLLHQPDYVNRVKNLAIYDLVLSGHSHGGQIRLPGYFPKTAGARNYTDSLYLPAKNTLLSVNTGIGTTALPLRFRVPPEIVYYHLSKKEEAFGTSGEPFDFKKLIHEETAEAKEITSPKQSETSDIASNSPVSDSLTTPVDKAPVTSQRGSKIVEFAAFPRRYHLRKTAETPKAKCSL